MRYESFVSQEAVVQKLRNDLEAAGVTFFITLFFAVFFLEFQMYEYYYLDFYLSDGIYASLFYLLTGLHGFHVLLGTGMLTLCYIRLHRCTQGFSQFTLFQYFPNLFLKSAIWYGHFVDGVWLFLYLFVYLVSMNALMDTANTHVATVAGW